MRAPIEAAWYGVQHCRTTETLWECTVAPYELRPSSYLIHLTTQRNSLAEGSSDFSCMLPESVARGCEELHLQGRLSEIGKCLDVLACLANCRSGLDQPLRQLGQTGHV